VNHAAYLKAVLDILRELAAVAPKDATGIAVKRLWVSVRELDDSLDVPASEVEEAAEALLAMQATAIEDNPLW
jgi:hypothetical protein